MIDPLSKMPPHGRWSFPATCTRVTHVYDGDTLKLDVDLGFRHWYHQMKCRLWGIDAPEIKGDTNAEARKARDELRRLVFRRPMSEDPQPREMLWKSELPDPGKYGRFIGTLYVLDDNGDLTDLRRWINAGAWLEKKNLVTPYEAHP